MLGPSKPRILSSLYSLSSSPSSGIDFQIFVGLGNTWTKAKGRHFRRVTKWIISERFNLYFDRRTQVWLGPGRGWVEGTGPTRISWVSVIITLNWNLQWHWCFYSLPISCLETFSEQNGIINNSEESRLVRKCDLNHITRSLLQTS